MQGPALVAYVFLAFLFVLSAWKCIACDPRLGCP